MDFNLPEELQMLKDTVRKFVDKELIPVEMHTIENMELKPDIRERLEKKTKEMGLVDVRCAGRIRRRRSWAAWRRCWCGKNWRARWRYPRAVRASSGLKSGRSFTL